MTAVRFRDTDSCQYRSVAVTIVLIMDAARLRLEDFVDGIEAFCEHFNAESKSNSRVLCD